MVRTVRPGSPNRESASFLENQDQDLSNPYSLPSSPSRTYGRVTPTSSPSRSPIARFTASPLARRPIPPIPAPSDLSRAGPVPDWGKPDDAQFSDIDHLNDSRINYNNNLEQDNDDDVFSSSHYSSPRRPLPTAPSSRSPSPTRYRPATSSLPRSPFLDEDNASDTARTINNASPILSGYDLKSHSNLSFSRYSFDDGRSVGSAETLHIVGKDKGQLGDEEDEVYMAPPVSQPRRHKDVVRKEVKLVDGNLVLDCPIATKLKSFLPRRDLDEFKYMRYTAATCDANEFADSGFTIRPAVQERETEIAICVTMYNEDEHLFTRTMHAIIKNISHLCSREKSRIWGKDGWKKIVVCIVSDGRKKIHPRVLDTLAAMGIYQDGIAKNFVNGKKVQSHIYEYTTQVSIDPQLKFKGAEKGLVPVQLMFCLKEENKGKLNSHRWFFNAFCPLLDPNVCVLVDVGTKPGNKAIYHLWKTFDMKSNVAGACGEIQTMAGKTWRNLLNPLVACQNFEYKLANMLDKPMESAFGFITVLPGAFSAYRYHALVSTGIDHAQPRPLDQYFKGESKAGSSADIFTANMYLAEDRILCWELVSRKGEQWVLQYVPNATAETDVPDSVAEFISQRRRWLNGSFFASLYSQLHFKQIWETDHSKIRKIMFHVEFVYQFFNLLFSFFSLSNFYLAFYFVAGCLSVKAWDPMALQGGLILFDLFKYLIIILLACQFVISLGNRPSGARHLFIASIVIFAIVTIYTFSCGIYFIASTVAKASSGSEYADSRSSMVNIYVSLLSTIGLYVFISFVYLQPWHVATCMVQYLLIMPSYTCVLQVYALCNTHDVSWGTKGENETSQDLGSAIVKKQGSAETDLVVEVEIPAGQNDIDSGYDEALMNLRDRKPVPEPVPDGQLLQQDYYREVRTRVVIVWMVGNLILVFIMVNVFSLNQAGKNWYLIFILWSVAVLTAFRAIGSLVFLAIRGCEYLYHTKVKTLERADEFKSRHGLTKQQRRRNKMKTLVLSNTTNDSSIKLKRNPFHDSMSVAGVQDDEDDEEAASSVYSHPRSAAAYSSIATESSRF